MMPMIWEVRIWEGMLCASCRSLDAAESVTTAEQALPLLLAGQTAVMTNTELRRMRHLVGAGWRCENSATP